MASDSVPVPFSEPPYLLGLPSPYYTPELRKWQKACREFITKNLTEHAWEWEKEGTVPDDVYQKFAKVNLLVAALPSPLPVEDLKRHGVHDILGVVKVEDYTYFHCLIFNDEMMRSGLGGPGSSITVGFAFGVPPLIKFGTQELKDRYLPDLLSGKSRTCIAITEPDAGSDVAGVTTEGVKSKDGKKWIINGTKKWITNGLWSDYAAMAVRTGGPGAKGLSMIWVPLKGNKGVEMRRIHVSGQKSAGTTFIELDDVEVPVENLMGQEGRGMIQIMTNFNHERLTICITATRQARFALSSAFAYVLKREAFGAPLMDIGVVRHRLAKCGVLLESHWAWIEQFVYQMSNMKKEDADVELGGLTAAAKGHTGVVLKECVDAMCLLFGGNGYTKSGQGEIAEVMWREVNGIRIPGGSEDVMLDLMIRQLAKNYQKKTKELESSRKSKI